MDPSAIRDVNLCHILPSRSYFHQEIIVYLRNRATKGEMNAISNNKNMSQIWMIRILTCCRPLRSICFQNWKSKQRSLQYLQTKEAHRQRSFTVKWESTCKDAKEDIMHKNKCTHQQYFQYSKSYSTTFQMLWFTNKVQSMFFHSIKQKT